MRHELPEHHSQRLPHKQNHTVQAGFLDGPRKQFRVPFRLDERDGNSANSESTFRRGRNVVVLFMQGRRNNQDRYASEGWAPGAKAGNLELKL